MAKLWVRSLFGCFRKATESFYVELVLRGADGAFQPVSWLMSTFCHEVRFVFDVWRLYSDLSPIARAYKGMCLPKPGILQLHCIQHMNHSPAFQALWRRLNAEVRALQLKGYYGDGKDLMDSPQDAVMTHPLLNRLLVIRDASSRFCQSWWPWIRCGGTTRIYGSYSHPFSTPISLKCTRILSVVVHTQGDDQRLYVADATPDPVKRPTMQYRRSTLVDKLPRNAKLVRE